MKLYTVKNGSLHLVERVEIVELRIYKQKYAFTGVQKTELSIFFKWKNGDTLCIDICGEKNCFEPFVNVKLLSENSSEQEILMNLHKANSVKVGNKYYIRSNSTIGNIVELNELEFERIQDFLSVSDYFIEKL